MSSKPSLNIILILFIAALILSACQGNQTPAPTRDVNAIYTQAAQTIVAGLQATQEAVPTSTPTLEPVVVNTTEPTEDVAATATALAELQAVATTAAQTAAVSPTSPPPPATATLVPVFATATPVQDRADLASLTPARGISVQKGASWDMTLTVRNSGGKTWNKGYSLAYHTGNQMGSPKDYYLTKEVKPGESYTFAFPMTAPGETGKQQVYWAFRDDNGSHMLYIDFDVNVTD